jgi:hypothetical protein
MADSAVTAMIEELANHARQLGATYGVSLKEFPLEPSENEPARDDGLALLRKALVPRDLLSLERVHNEWGLWFRASVGGVTARDPVSPVKLRDAPLVIRRKFLHRSEAFFDAYFQRVDEGLGESRQAVEAGERTLQKLRARAPKAPRVMLARPISRPPTPKPEK